MISDISEGGTNDFFNALAGRLTATGFNMLPHVQSDPYVLDLYGLDRESQEVEGERQWWSS